MGRHGKASETLSATVSRDLYAAVKRIADAQERSISYVAGKVLSEWYQQQLREEQAPYGLPSPRSAKLPRRPPSKKAG